MASGPTDSVFRSSSSEEGVARPQGGASSSSWRHASLPLYFAILSVTYASTLTVPYAFSDTYMVLARALHRDLWDSQIMMVLGGRPLLALVTSLYFPYVHTIAELRWIRLLGLLGLALFASIYAAMLRRQGVPSALAWGLPVLTACLPPFQVYVAWAVCAPYTWAAALAGLAFVALERDLSQPWRMGLSVIALLAAILLYQPAAMTFWVFAASAWLTGRRSPSVTSIVTAGAVMGIAMALDFALVELLPGLFFSANMGRTHLATHLVAKLVWFVHTPLREAANLTSIVPSTTVALTVLAWITAGLALYWRRRGMAALWFAALALALIPLSYLPNLVVAENWASYRTQVALTSLLLLYAALALIGWLQWLHISRAVTGIVVAAAGTAVFMAADTVTREFALPQKEEWLLVKQALARPPAATAAHLYLRLASWQDHLAPVSRWDEFGLPSTSRPPVVAPMAWLLAHMDGVAAARNVTAVLPRNATIADLSSDSCIVDLGGVLRGLAVQCHAALQK